MSEGVHELEEVFMPSAVQINTFVERPSVGFYLERCLAVKGRPVCVVGPYQSGKSTLTLNKVRKKFKNGCIHIQCQKESSFNDIVKDAFEDLAPFYLSEKKINKKGVSSEAIIDFFNVIKARLGSSNKQVTETEKRVVEPSLSSRMLAKFCAAANVPLIVDDANRLEYDEFSKLCEAVREWQATSFPEGAPKIVLIGGDKISTTLDQDVLSAVDDLANRLSVIRLSFMTEYELKDIVETGGKLLNVDFSEVIDQIIFLSKGYPGVCQDICYHICLERRVLEQSNEKIIIQKEDKDKGLKSYIEHCQTKMETDFFKLLEEGAPGQPYGFVKDVFSIIVEEGTDGVAIEKVMRVLSRDYGINEINVLEGLKSLCDTPKPILTVDKSKNVIKFQDPMHYFYFAAQYDLEDQLINFDAEAKKIVEAFKVR